MMRIASAGHAAFAVTLIFLGVLGLIKGDFAAIWDPVPKAMPAREALVYLCAFISLGCGAGLLWEPTRTVAARVLLAYLVLWTLMFKARFIVLAPLVEGTYQSCGENAVLVAGAWILYAWFAGEWDRRRLGFASREKGVRVAGVIYAFAMIAFGLSHFVYLNLTAPLVPAWLPGPVAWAYFTGAAYLAAGASVLFNIYARLAVALSALQMALFTLLVWVAKAAAGDMSAFDWGELELSWALTAAACVMADAYRGVPWLALGRTSAVAHASGASAR